MLDWIACQLVKILGWLLCRLPPSVAVWLGERLGELGYWVQPKRRQDHDPTLCGLRAGRDRPRFFAGLPLEPVNAR